MKIAIFEPHPSYGGGSERVALDVARNMAMRGHEVFLAHDTTGTMLPAYDEFLRERHRTRLKPFGWRTLAPTLLRSWRMNRCWKRWEVDLVFSSDIQYIRFLCVTSLGTQMPIVLHLGIENPLPYRSQLFALKRFAA